MRKIFQPLKLIMSSLNIDLRRKNMELPNNIENLFHGKENAPTAARLMQDGWCVITGYGQSMTPILKNAQPALVQRVDDHTELKKGDIVFCKVKGRYYLHKIWAVKGENSFLIGNNHGHANGTIDRRNIFGIVRKIL